MASFMPGVAFSIGTMSTTSPVVMIECLSVGCELGWRNPEAALDDLAHERGGGGFMGPGFELARGLADEHLDAVDGFGAGGLGGLQELGLHGVVDGVEDEVVGGELDVEAVDGGGAGVGVHADGRGVDEDLAAG